MTFKDLKKRVTLTIQQHNQSNNLLFNRLRDKSFWIWNSEEHKREDIIKEGDCCFNHIVGLPTKDDVEKPMFDYQKLLYDSPLTPESCNSLNHTFKLKHLWVTKGTGLGVTEFFLRLMVWLCLKDDTFRNSQMCIVTGPNIG